MKRAKAIIVIVPTLLLFGSSEVIGKEQYPAPGYDPVYTKLLSMRDFRQLNQHDQILYLAGMMATVSGLGLICPIPAPAVGGIVDHLRYKPDMDLSESVTAYALLYLHDRGCYFSQHWVFGGVRGLFHPPTKTPQAPEPKLQFK